MKKIFAFLAVITVVICCLTGCVKTVETGEIEYSDIIGLWGTSDGKNTISFSGKYDESGMCGRLASLEGNTSDETDITYVLTYDTETDKSMITIKSDSHSETFTAKLNGDFLILTHYNTETDEDETIKFIKDQGLIMPENVSESTGNTYPATTEKSENAEVPELYATVIS